VPAQGVYASMTPRSIDDGPKPTTHNAQRTTGFDVVLGNPPWERIKLQEKEFFAARDPQIAHAPNKAARERLIKTLPDRKPDLAKELASAQHDAESSSRFVRTSGRFPLCGRGDVNTYSVFGETARTILGPLGRAGNILPTGIATDDTTKDFFADLMNRGSLASLYDFENKNIFPHVHSSYKFCLLTLSGSAKPIPEATSPSSSTRRPSSPARAAGSASPPPTSPWSTPTPGHAPSSAPPATPS
jgi:hypothetical protein